MRYRIVLLVGTLAVVVGTCFGAIAFAGSDALEQPPRAAFLQAGDIAIFGGVQCIANIEGGRKHLLCQRRPRSKARYEVAVFPRSILVYRMGRPDDPVYVTP